MVNHIDGDKLNNNYTNLEWCTSQYNTQHAVEKGLITGKKGEESTSAKLTWEDVKYIRENYKPYSNEFGTRALSRKFTVTHETIRDVLNFTTWVE